MNVSLIFFIKKAPAAETASKKSKNETKEQEESENEEEKPVTKEDLAVTEKEKVDEVVKDDNKEYNLKVVSWNVNGIRAWTEVYEKKMKYY